MKRILTLLTLTLLLAAPLIYTGCGTLDPAGVYQGDKVLYEADMTISTSYDVVHSFVLWEYTNRATLKTMPQVKEYADYLRLNYPLWHRAAISARSVYTSSKSTANANALQLTLAVLRNAMTQAQQWMANGSTSAPIIPQN